MRIHTTWNHCRTRQSPDWKQFCRGDNLQWCIFVQSIFTVSYWLLIHLHYVFKLIEHSNDATHSFLQISRASILCSWYFMEHHPMSRLSTIAVLEHSFMKVMLKWACECCLFAKLHQCLFHISKILSICKNECSNIYAYMYLSPGRIQWLSVVYVLLQSIVNLCSRTQLLWRRHHCTCNFVKLRPKIGARLWFYHAKNVVMWTPIWSERPPH